MKNSSRPTPPAHLANAAEGVADYVRISESFAIECLKIFVTNVILIFESEYLRNPNSNDVQRLLKMKKLS